MNVQITLVEQLEDRVISGNAIEVHTLHPDGSIGKEMIKSAITDKNGIAHFYLPQGTYRAMPAGSWVGSTDFSLSSDKQKLKITMKVQSILN